MTDAHGSITRVPAGAFRLGRVFDRTLSVYRRNFLPFGLVSLIASAPPLLLEIYVGTYSTISAPVRNLIVTLLTMFSTVVLGLLSQAILVYGAFQDLRGLPVNLFESAYAGLRRIFPVFGLIIIAALGIIIFIFGMLLIVLLVNFALARSSLGPALGYFVGFASLIGTAVLVIVGLMLIARWSVAVPVCMVERFGPWKSLKRSSQLTKGNRWKIFGIILLLYIIIAVVSHVSATMLTSVGGNIVALLGALVWNTIWATFLAVFLVVMYYELRVAKDGVGIEQITAVFD